MAGTDNLTPLVVKTKNPGDVVAKIVDTGGTNQLAVSASGAASVLAVAGSNIIGKVGIDQTTPGTTNGVQITGPGASVGNALYINYATGTVGTTSGNPMFEQLTAGSAIVGKVGIDQTTPGTTNGVQINAALPTGSNTIGAVTQASGPWTQNLTQINGTSIGSPTAAGTSTTGNVLGIQGVTSGVSVNVAITGSLPTGTNSIGTVGLNAGSNIIGQVSINQTTPGTTNAVQISGPGTSTGNPLYVSSGAVSVGTLKNSGQIISSSVVAAGGGTSTLAASAITSGKVGSLQHVICTSSAPMRYDIQTVNTSGTATTVFSLFSSGAQLSIEYKPQNATEISTVSADGTNTKFQVLVTNEDQSNAVSAYAFIAWAEN